MNHFVVGLTGGIGSGKSSAADFFADLGAKVVDTDMIARELTRPGGAAIPAIHLAFGPEVIDKTGGMDRARMRDLVFSDSEAKARLEAILHPMIRDESNKRCKDPLKREPYIVLVVPLLIETKGFARGVDRIAVVDCKESDQVSRVMTRSALSEAEIKRIMSSQVSRATRLEAADDVIENTGDLLALRKRIEALHRKYLDCAVRKRDSGDI